MEIFMVVALVLLTLSSIAQTFFLIGAAREGRKLGARLETLESEMRPHVERFVRVTANLEELSENAGRQLARVDDFVRGSADVASATGQVLGRVLRPTRTIALFRALRRGLEIYRQVRPRTY
jgi:hypothetical protein